MLCCFNIKGFVGIRVGIDIGIPVVRMDFLQQMAAVPDKCGFLFEAVSYTHLDVYKRQPEEVVMQPRLTIDILVLQSERLVHVLVNPLILFQMTPAVVVAES